MPIVDRARVVQSYLPKWEGYNAPTNYASIAGHPCDRYLTLNRTHGQFKDPPDDERRGHMERGKQVEGVALAQLKAAGYEVYHQQFRVEIVEENEVVWRGKIEGVIRDPGKGQAAPVHPLEVKSPSEYAWEKYNTIEDVRRGPWYHQRWGDQLLIYIYAKAESDVGVLCLMHPRTLLPKYIEVPMDYGRVQELIERGRRVNAHLKAGTLPDPIEWGRTCETCDLLSICLPDQVGGAGTLQVWDHPAFIEKLERREELAGPAEEFKQLDREVKEATRGKGEIMAGDFHITSRDVEVKSYTVQARTDQRVTIRRTNTMKPAKEGAA